MDEVRSFIKRDKNGDFVLYDDAALGAYQAISNVNKKRAFFNSKNAIYELSSFVKEKIATIQERGTVDSQCIVLIDVDDNMGSQLADVLMPGYDWDQYRVQNQRPVARGIVSMAFIEEIMRTLEGHVLDCREVSKGEGDVGVFTLFYDSALLWGSSHLSDIGVL